MAQFFGKRGIAHLGIQFIWLKTDEELAADEDMLGEKKFVSKYHTHYLDILCDDSKEDTFQVSAEVECALKWFKRDHRHIHKSIFLTDGACCFASTAFLFFLACLGNLTGIRTVEFYIR